VIDCEVYLMHNFKRSLSSLTHLSSYSSNSEEGKELDLNVKVDDNLLHELKKL